MVTDGVRLCLVPASGSWLRVESRGAARGGVRYTGWREPPVARAGMRVLPFFFFLFPSSFLQVLLSAGSVPRQLPGIPFPRHVSMRLTLRRRSPFSRGNYACHFEAPAEIDG